MTSFIFCIIFIQVSIFFIVCVLLLTLFYMSFTDSELETARASNRSRVRQRKNRPLVFNTMANDSD